MFPEYRRVWTNLSEVYLKKKQFDYSLRALNNIEIDSKLFNSITQDINFDIKKHQKSYLIFNEVSLSLDKKKTTTVSLNYSDILIPPHNVDIIYVLQYLIIGIKLLFFRKI